MVHSDGAYCAKNPDGSGWCGGTMRGFRNDPGPNTYALFALGHDGTFGFTANYGNQYFRCDFATPPAPAFQSAVASGNGYFNVYWNAAGSCYWGFAYRGSGYGSSY